MANMKRWMQEEHLKYADIADVLGLTPSTVWQKVNGNYSWLPKDMKALEKVFGLPPAFVLDMVPFESLASSQSKATTLQVR